MTSSGELRLRMQASTLERLRECLFPGDSSEALAFALCGLARTPFSTDLLVREVIPLPGSGYRSRSGQHLTWSTQALLPLLGRLADEQLCLVKCHSHPGVKLPSPSEMTTAIAVSCRIAMDGTRQGCTAAWC